MPKSLSRLITELTKAEQDLARAWAMSTDPDRLYITPDGISAEEYDRLCRVRHLADHAVQRAIWDPAIARRERFRNRKQAPRAGDAVKLRQEMYRAQSHFETLENLGPSFYTTAEWHEARAAAWLAEEIYDIAEAKFQEEQRQIRADKRAGIVRIRQQRKPRVRHL